MKFEKIMIAGLGALGLTYAEYFSKVPGVTVCGLVDKERKERYERDGRIWNGERRDYPYITPDMTDVKADLVLVATKSSGLEAAIKEIPNVLKDDTVIMSVMNGISSEPMLAEAFGADRVIGAVYLGHPGQNVNGQVSHDGSFKTYIGELEGATRSERITALEELFNKAGMNVNVPDSIQYKLWAKFMMLVAFNQPTVLYDTDWTPYTQYEGGMDLSEHLMEEVCAVAAAAGVEGADEMVKENREFVKRSPLETNPPIHQDFTEGRRMEADILSGEVVRRGKEYGLDTPYNQAVYDVLNILNQKNAKR
ncbi:MAG: 2-dehydropantoate 2-reductase [Anaerovoracaceae bacterium]|nr:2-dehydropantoate 2-reductase [Anaerovoracaceae bacterium]